MFGSGNLKIALTHVSLPGNAHLIEDCTLAVIRAWLKRNDTVEVFTTQNTDEGRPGNAREF